MITTPILWRRLKWHYSKHKYGKTATHNLSLSCMMPNVTFMWSLTVFTAT